MQQLFNKVAQGGTEDEDGNTTLSVSSSSNARKEKRFRNWFFTLNNYTADDISLWDNGKTCPALKFLMQEEKGIKSGTEHLQGYFELKNPRTLIGLKREFGDKYHFEPARNKEACIEYCRKIETRNGRQWSKGFRKPPKVITTLRPWQAEVVKIVQSEPDDRSIYWFWDAKGGSGKTQLAKYLCVKFDTIYVSGKAADIKFAITKYLENHDSLKCVIYDITRSQEAFLSYQAIEECKNGIFFSGKYESEQVIFDPPHVIIFANFAPDMEKLSSDRWHITCLDGTCVSLDARDDALLATQ